MTAFHNLTILKTGATRFQGNDLPSCIDLIMTNTENLVEKPILINSSSDHKIISVTLVRKVKENKPNLKIGRSYKNYSKKEILKVLDIPYINSFLCCTNTDMVAEALVYSINKALDIVAPMKKTQIRKNYAPFLSEDTKKLMNERNNLKATANTSKNPVDMSNYRKIRNAVLAKQRGEKKDWSKKLIGEKVNRGANIWNTVKSLNGDKKGKGLTKIIANGISFTKPVEMANSLNDKFPSKQKTKK